MNVKIHEKHKGHLSRALTEQMFYVLCSRIDEYAYENHLSEMQKRYVYKKLLNKIRNENYELKNS